MGTSRREKSGKGIEGAAAFERQMARQMGSIHQLDSWCQRQDDDEFDLVSLHLRAPREEGEDFLMVVRAWVNGEQMVGFHGADTIAEAVVGTCNRIRNKTMKWRQDDYVDKAS